MPLHNSITVLPTDLENILHSLRQLKHNAPIKIIDTQTTLTIRDIDEGFLTEVKREEEATPDD